MTDDERTEPGRDARRAGRPRQPGPPPPWPGEEGTVPNAPASRPAPRGNGQPPVGYGQPGYGQPGPRSTPPGRPQQALPPGRHAGHTGQDGAPDRAPGSYQGNRRNVPPNGTPAGNTGRPDATQPGVTPGRPQDRTDPLTDPSYAQRPGTGLARAPQPRRGGPRPDDARYPGTPPAGYGSYGNGARGNGTGGDRAPGNGTGSNGAGAHGIHSNGDRTAGYRAQAPGSGPAPGSGQAPGYGAGVGYGGGAGYGGDGGNGGDAGSRRGAGYAPGQYGSEGPGQGGDAYPGAVPGPRGGRSPRDGQHQRDGGYRGDRPPQRNSGYQRDQSGQRDGGYPPDDRDRGRDDRYQDDSRYQPDGGHAEPEAYRGRRRSNAPAPDDYSGFGEGAAQHTGHAGHAGPPGPSAQHAEGPRTHRAPNGPDGPDGPDGPGAEDPAAAYDDYEDDRFVPGLGGSRYRDDDDEAYEDEGYEDDGDGAQGPRGPRGTKGRSGRGSKPKRRRSRWIAPLIAVVVILTPVVIGGVYAFNLYQSKYHPADYSTAGTGQAIVQVQSGQTATAVGDRLVTLGVVASVRAFELAAEHNPNGNGLEPGFYRVHKQMKASLAFALLLNPAARIQDKITIPEGWRLSQIETALGARSGIPVADYQRALRSPGAFGLPTYANGNPEGYLFPATYAVEPNMSATTVLQAMVNRFNQEATTINLPAAATQAHMTPAQVIIVASLLQAEGGAISDYPKIARVIVNRLAANMPLQFDSTVLYGLGKFGTTVTFKQINSNTPYNTYQHKGLPPGPIDSPGNAAIQAALHPAAGNWLYFVANKKGVTKFSSTLAGLGG